MLNKFIILDRDGVINHGTESYIKTPEEFHAIPGSLEAIVALNQAGFKVLIATNQSGIAKGLYSLQMLDAVHKKLCADLSALGGVIDAIFCCPHHPDENCFCRKPKPGLLYQIHEKYNLPRADTFFVGDSHVDVEAALEFGCKPMLVLTGKGEKALQDYPHLAHVPAFKDLACAVRHILGTS